MNQWHPQQIDRLKLIGVMLQFHRDNHPIDRLAARLQIDPAILLALERGQVEFLPTPKQTRLIIHHYARVLGVDYLNLADNLPLVLPQSDARHKTAKTNKIALPRMPKRSVRKYRWISFRRKWKRFFSPISLPEFSIRLPTFLQITSPPSLKSLRQQSNILQLWLGLTLVLGACLGMIVAIAHLIFVVLSPEGRMLFQQSPWGIFWLGVFEFLKVFISFTCFFSLLLWWGTRKQPAKRSLDRPKVPPNDSREKSETPHDR